MGPMDETDKALLERFWRGETIPSSADPEQEEKLQIWVEAGTLEQSRDPDSAQLLYKITDKGRQLAESLFSKDSPDRPPS